ncbi:Sugar phosphate isomerase/epimerase [Neorhodopirellula lusitana]|uniref:Sugar phosphate isomerase/epimerase n=1 Tax=Neorhodopirellula lusitana TaxID=445327 RepID=A0ABY1PPE5_9BACT|nr:TIM barrel protein [Neorhodopirellula lusitana]SMP40772.1 Sugar phosphate isomerase/epimerase [Neorhodopirellula lusitana]
MFKNFCPQALGINGRQSELIELALTYAFRGMDIDMHDMLRRSQRSSFDDAAKYLKATEIRIGSFTLAIDLDADDDAFTAAVATLHPLSEIAAQLEVDRALVRVPAATNRLPFNEFFDVQRTRISQIADVLGARDIKLGVGFQAGKEHTEGKEFPFISTVETFRALVDAIPSVGYLIDTWDWVVGDGAMDQLGEIPGEKIVAVRLGSLPEDVEASAATTSDRVLPAKDGILDHVKVVAHLEESAFAGPISPTASTSQYKGETREFLVQKAQEAIDDISRDAGLTVAPLPMDLIEDIPYEPTPMM